MLSLYPLGVNGLYGDKNSPSSGYLLDADGKKFLLDVGSGVFSRLLEITRPEDLAGIIISHFHFDHSSDLGVLSYYLQSKNAKLKVYAPNDGSPLFNAFSSSPYLDFVQVSEGEKLSINGLLVDFYKMNHPVYTLGASFLYEGKRLSYTADTNLCDSLDKLCENADLILADSAFLKKEWSDKKPHLSAEHCAFLGKKHGAKVLLTHLNPAKSKDEYLQEAIKFYDRVELAESKKYVL